MRYHHRIRTIYVKELIDILRDRRTLLAMIVVPIVMYPLLMLGSIQAVSYQVRSLDDEAIRFGVLTEDDGKHLHALILRDAEILSRVAERQSAENAGDEEDAPKPLDHDHYEVRATASREALEDAIRERQLHLGVLIEKGPLIRGLYRRIHVEFLVDSDNVRSFNAMTRLQGVIERTRDRLFENRLAQVGLPKELAKPYIMHVSDLATSTSMLGQILPLILILLTITGAIYPAIDLTAGERERGTLETLMVCPVPVIDLVVGKFLVVTSVAIMGAALNLTVVSATIYFGGFNRVLAGTEETVPLGKMALILLALIPFAVLMSAVMIAVCSYARTFKEAQNYVTPVILAVLIPGGIAALPATQLAGVMLVMPVGNMVLLARDLLLGAEISWWQVSLVLVSTSLYAGAAVAVAANIFGKESVVFADSASLKTIFSRRLIKPAAIPPLSMSLLVVALLFPTWFFVQAYLSPGPDEGMERLLRMTGLLMPLLFVVCPTIVLLYWRTDIVNTFALRRPGVRSLAAGVLIGLSSWVVARELNVLQSSIIVIPAEILQSFETMAASIVAMPWWMALLLVAVVPAVCEELLFRGFFLSGLMKSARPATAILVSAAVFAVFHFLLFKFLVTAVLGVVFAYLCWRSRSILPGMVAHLLHNAIGALMVIEPSLPQKLGIESSDGDTWAHLPAHVLLPGVAVFVLALILIPRPAPTAEEDLSSASVDIRSTA
ncbi:MAG: ABC transporter permease subunit [Planctomycetes bacterium]|nr:ABC transporter permease subunit [Planctomycetota bacterium]